MDLPNGSGLLDEEGIKKFRVLCLEYGFQDGQTFRNPSAEELLRDEAQGFAQKLVEIGYDFCRRNSHRKDSNNFST
jgi:hypothetical protein